MLRAQVTCPGAYRCVCVRLKLYSLAVTAVVKSEVLAELEGASSATAGVDAGAAPAFRVLKQLVASWLADASQHHNRCLLLAQLPMAPGHACLLMMTGGSTLHGTRKEARRCTRSDGESVSGSGRCGVVPRGPTASGAHACRFADALLQNLWRWLCSPAAALACPGLQRSVAALMRKTLAQLARVPPRPAPLHLPCHFFLWKHPPSAVVMVGGWAMPAPWLVRRALRRPCPVTNVAVQRVPVQTLND